MRWFLGATVPPATIGYRPDVDGLRAVAVSSVVLFHLSPRLCPGGFIGVDVFFVISGYLISGILFKEHAAGRFAFGEFYGRRIRRLAPALIVVLAACLAFGWVFLIGGEYKSLGRHTAVSAVFGSNLLLYSEIDYFAPAASEKPLVHLWSLGIEEQFYILWPLLIWIVWSHRARLTLLLVAGVVLSFTSSVLLTRWAPEAAFYLPHARYWELLVGALIAYHEMQRLAARSSASARASTTASSPAARRWLAWAGLVLIAVSLYQLDGKSVFPGWWAAVPVAGAAALIAAGPGTWVTDTLLGNRVMTSIGGLAYPIYLWHWPLLAFVFLAGGSRTVRVMAVVATLVLAWLTKVSVEDPLRFGSLAKGRQRHVTAMALLAILLIVGGAGLITDRADGFPSRYVPELWPLTGDAPQPSTGAASAESDLSCFMRPAQTAPFPASCAGESTAAVRTLLWGDSFAYHLEPGLRRLASERGFALARYTGAACPPIIDMDFRDPRQCRSVNAFVLGKVRESRFNTVILAGNWMLYGGEVSRQIGRTVRAVKAAGVPHVVVIGPAALWPAALPSMLARGAILSGAKTVPSRLMNDSVPSTLELDRLVREAALQAGADYVSLIDILCSRDGMCLTLDREPGSRRSSGTLHT